MTFNQLISDILYFSDFSGKPKKPTLHRLKFDIKLKFHKKVNSLINKTNYIKKIRKYIDNNDNNNILDKLQAITDMQDLESDILKEEIQKEQVKYSDEGKPILSKPQKKKLKDYKKKLFEIMNAQNLEKWEYLYQNEYLKNFIDMFTTYEDLVDIFYKIDISEFTEFIDRYENIQEKDMIEIEQWIRDKEMLINHKEDVARIYSYIDSITEEKTLEPIKNFIEKQEQEQSVVDI